MIDICNEINESLDSLDFNASLNTLCELVLKNNQPHPITCDTRKQIAPDDTYDAVIYHRLLNASGEDDEANSYGSRMSRKISQRLRTVVLLKHALGEDKIYEIIGLYPDKITLSGYKYINIGSSVDLNVDHEGIHSQEFGGVDYERHRLAWNIYAIELNVEFVKC